MQQTGTYYPEAGGFIPELTLAQCGWEACRGGHSYGPAVRDHYLVHYVARGQGTFYKDGKARRLGVGEGFVIYPWETTTYVADGDDPWEYYWVGFSGMRALSLLDSCGISAQSPVFRLTRPPKEVAACIQSIHTHASFSTGGELRALGQLLHFLSLVMDEAPAAHRERADTAQSEYVEAAIRIIQERHADGLTVGTLAAAVGIDRTHLFRAFKSCLGTGPQQYLVGFRVKRACQLLAETAMPVGEIAEYVGFSSPNHLGVAFRNLQGVPPREYRARFMRGPQAAPAPAREVAKPRQYYDNIYEDREAMFKHSPYALEERLSQAVTMGEEALALAALREISAQGSKAVLAKDPLRSVKNSMIGSIAFLARAAIQAGVSANSAFALSDALTQRVEEMPHVDAVLAFEESILLQFIALVRQRLGEAYTAPVVKVMHYVENHLDTKISLEAAAGYAGVHPAYLSARFKKETGHAFTSYISLRKIQESSYFVRHTDYSVSQIASLYGFSSQSYYITIFKRVMGMTPAGYRRQLLAE